jgi:hypothetical protein
MRPTSKPPYVECYQKDGVTVWMNSGDPIKARIAKDVIMRATGISWERIHVMMYAGFWIIEGLVHSHDFTIETHPTLCHYFEQREGLNMDERWELYASSVEVSELDFLQLAHDNTRRHVLETMTDLSLEKKETS